MENLNIIDEEVFVYVINKYIQFYKKEIKNTDFFDGVTIENYGSTSDQMELFNIELEKFKKLDEDFKNLCSPKEINKKYVITKNREKILASDSLLSVLIELYNLENEEPEYEFQIILNKNI